MIAAYFGQQEIVNLLIRAGVEVSFRNNSKRTAMHYAAAVAKQLLQAGAKVDAKDEWLTTPLMIAAINGNLDTVRLLLEAKAKIEARDKDHWTALHYAACEGYEPAAVLIEKGAETHREDRDGRTALFYAALNDHREIAQFFVANGMDLHKKDKQGLSASMLNPGWRFADPGLFYDPPSGNWGKPLFQKVMVVLPNLLFSLWELWDVPKTS